MRVGRTCVIDTRKYNFSKSTNFVKFVFSRRNCRSTPNWVHEFSPFFRRIWYRFRVPLPSLPSLRKLIGKEIQLLLGRCDRRVILFVSFLYVNAANTVQPVSIDILYVCRKKCNEPLYVLNYTLEGESHFSTHR